MRVLIACEFSGIVRDAFIAKGHDALSCDILPSDREGPHYQGDVRDILEESWDLMVAFPPCTDLAISGASHFPAKIADGRQGRALSFVQTLMDAPITRIAIENPIGVISSKIRKPDQIIQPWQYGHPAFKSTCLWLNQLPKLKPTDVLEVPERNSEEWKRWQVVLKHSPSPTRGHKRSITYPGIAKAMADQWNIN